MTGLCLNNSDSVAVAYVDFAKAFDSVSHPKLIAKLSNLGIAGSLLKWIGQFLAGRLQCTVVGHARSEMLHMISGVPQGSVLGPLLFLVFINDVVDVFPPLVKVKLFADDIKLYSIVNSVNDCVTLQGALDRLLVWFSAWP